MSEGDIRLPKASGAALSGVKEVGTAAGDDPEEPLSRIVQLVNEKYGTEWTPADQLFLDQIKEEALADRSLMESARVNTEENFRFRFDKVLENKFMDRMDQNSAIFERFMSDAAFQQAVTRYLLKQVMSAARAEPAGAEP